MRWGVARRQRADRSFTRLPDKEPVIRRVTSAATSHQPADQHYQPAKLILTVIRGWAAKAHQRMTSSTLAERQSLPWVTGGGHLARFSDGTA